MLGKHSKLIFTVSMGFLVVAVIMAAWGFQKIVDKQIQNVSVFFIFNSITKH